MTDYSKLSDREIDRLVLSIIYGIHANDKDIQGCWSRGGFKYTSNASDAWQIITANKISLLNHWDPDGDDVESSIWSATTNIDKTWCDPRSDGCESTHKNPLRAAMIVFLQMQENKQ